MLPIIYEPGCCMIEFLSFNLFRIITINKSYFYLYLTECYLQLTKNRNMENRYSFLFLSGLFFILIFSDTKVNAQYVPVHDNQGKLRSNYDRAAEEARNRSTINIDVSSKTKPTYTETPRQKADRIEALRKAAEAETKKSYGIYDFIGSSKDGLRPVKFRGKWGYLNKEDEVVIPIKYDELGFSGNDLFGIRLYYSWGFADRTGNVVIPAIYSSVISGFNSEGIACVIKNNKKIYINKQGVIVYDSKSDFSDGHAIVTLEEKKGFINGAGKQITALIYDDTNGFSEGMANVKMGNKWGYIDKAGKIIIPLKFDNADIFVHGLAVIKIDGKFGFLNKSGNLAIPLKYDSAGRFKDGLALVQINKKMGYIDSTGTAIIPIVYDDILPESLGYYALRFGNKWGFLNKKGVTVFPFIYDDVLSNFAEEPKDIFHPYANYSLPKASVIKDYEQFTIDIKGDKGYKKGIAPKGYDTAGSFSRGMASVRLNGKWGLINLKGEIVIPLLYDRELYCFDGLVSVCLNKKVGLLDTTGKVVTPIKYDDLGGILFIYNEFAQVALNGKWGLINKTGAEFISPKYDFITAYGIGTYFVRLNGKCGVIDKNGTEIIEIKYEEKCDAIDRSLYEFDRNSFIEKYGKEMVPLLHKENKTPDNGLVYFKLNGKFYPFDKHGQKLTPRMIK